MKVSIKVGSSRKRGNTYKVLEKAKTEIVSPDICIEFENEFMADYLERQ